MSVEIARDGDVRTIIHNWPEARNAADPQAAENLTEAFLNFECSGRRRHGVGALVRHSRDGRNRIPGRILQALGA